MKRASTTVRPRAPSKKTRAAPAAASSAPGIEADAEDEEDVRRDTGVVACVLWEHNELGIAYFAADQSA